MAIFRDDLLSSECQLRFANSIDARGLDCAPSTSIYAFFPAVASTYLPLLLVLLFLWTFQAGSVLKVLYLSVFLIPFFLPDQFTFLFPRDSCTASILFHLLQCWIDKSILREFLGLASVMLMLIGLDLKYLPLLIIFYLPLRKSGAVLKHRDINLWALLSVLTVIAVIFACDTNNFARAQGFIVSLLSHRNSSTYMPRFGVLWYFDALVIPKYVQYFSVLHTLLPWVAIFILTLIYGELEEQSILVKLSFAVILFFDRSPTALDVIFHLINLSSHNTVILQEMRYIQVLLILIATTMVLSPSMVYMWVYVGNGNANFLFFQGFAMWLSYGLFIIEFVGASERLKTRKLTSLASANTIAVDT